MRKVCIFTGGRAEYGLLKPLLDELKQDPNVDLKLLVAGMHLSREFGLTYQVIERDGFICDEKVEMILSSDSPISICKSMGLGLISYSEALDRMKPDILVTLGDRFENMAIVTSALVSRVPVAHIQGGEITRGAMDDQFRHCITKMSTFHFVTTEEYRKRVIQLGEEPHRVFNCGAINVDAMKKVEIMTKAELEESIGFKIDENTILVTFHPTTLEPNTSEKYFQELLDAIEAVPNLRVIFTKTLADTEGRVINDMIDEYAEKNRDKAISHTSLGQSRYMSALHYVKAVVGNSSSGIIETPTFKLPTVNIGNRELGRIIADNVICCKQNTNDIKDAIIKAMSDSFKNSLTDMKNPYEKEDTSKFIAEKLANLEIPGNTSKVFHDVNFEI